MPKQRYCEDDLRLALVQPGCQGQRLWHDPLHLGPDRPEREGPRRRPGGDFPAQARQALKNLRAMVEAGGGTLADVVKLTFFLTDVRYRQDLVPIREAFFGPKLPASTLITTPALAHPDYLIEIEALAFVEGR